MTVIEAVPNISEGRRGDVLTALADAVNQVPDVFLLNTSADPSHNRCVLSIVGPPAPLLDALLDIYEVALQSIDLRTHQGVHPRIGTVDVIPFVPISGVSMEQCVQIAHRLAEKIGRELKIPVYLYGEAATRPAFENLAHIRKGGFEQLGELIEKDPSKKPDFGPIRIHPTAGALAVGARQLLIAFNVYLESSDVEIAREIAASIRESGGGFAGIKALGFYIEHRDRAQVSMNMTAYRQSPLLQIFNRICAEAHRLGIEVNSSEIVGLAPQDALEEGALEALRLKNFDPDQILENSIHKALET